MKIISDSPTHALVLQGYMDMSLQKRLADAEMPNSWAGSIQMPYRVDVAWVRSSRFGDFISYPPEARLYTLWQELGEGGHTSIRRLAIIGPNYGPELGEDKIKRPKLQGSLHLVMNGAGPRITADDQIDIPFSLPAPTRQEVTYDKVPLLDSVIDIAVAFLTTGKVPEAE